MTNSSVQLGRTLRILREGQHLTQSELAQKMGVRRQTIYRWENGSYTLSMSLSTFFKLTKVLDTAPLTASDLIKVIEK